MREFREVRKDTPGDAAAPYIGVARTLLGVLKNRMTMGGIPVLSSTTILPDGAVITCMSVNGQDTIRIVPPVAPAPAIVAPRIPLPPLPGVPNVPQLVPTQACVWGPDIQTYSAPIPVFNTEYFPAVMSPQRDAMFVITGFPGPIQFVNTNTPAGSVTNATQLVQLNPDTLEVIGSSLIDYPGFSSTSPTPGIAADKSGYVGGFGFVRLPVFNVPGRSWLANTQSLWGSAGSASEILPPFNGSIPNNVGDELNLISMGTTYGAALSFNTHFVVNSDASDTAATSSLVTIDPVSGARSTLTWPDDAFIKSTGIESATALPDGNFLLADGNWVIYTIDPTGNQLKVWGEAPDFPLKVVQQGNALFVRGLTALYKFTDAGGWQTLQTFAETLDELLVYDSVKNAVGFVSPDGSGVTIYGGYDCMMNEMGTNFVAFGHPPVFTEMSATQMENGTLLVTFGQGAQAGVVGGTDTESTLIVGRFDIGLLNQTVANGFQETS